MMKCSKILGYLVGPLALANFALGHGQHSQKPIVDEDADWATKHMANEHHIGNFDTGAFFALHDFDNNGFWDGGEIQKFYGLMDVSNKDLPESKRVEVLKTILDLMDTNRNGQVERTEWFKFVEGGGSLPDFGTGPGHHGSFEEEYELHHWEQYHDENTTEEDLTHPEDIEHFRLHDEMEEEAERIAKMDEMSIVEKNIPKKFLRG